MKHLFRKGKDLNRVTFLLLHGTGGNEEDLLPIADMIDPDANVLSVRGNVLEHGMPRFFRRIAEGVFDIEDLIFRTKELYSFIQEKAEEYRFDPTQLVAIGYSNGANIAASLLFHYEDALNGAILYHAMVPLRDIELPNLNQASIFIGAGKQDPLIPAAETEELITLLQSAHANVTAYWLDGGHQLTREEVEESKKWFSQTYK
ncbi:alpha/beta hydrolase [Bacillus sp. JCM 19034]|uniref:alpha/beta hydrolase n=1 Tax=Bacillus sp. JCM 19034 TaxID=1481928 RepID=UPI00078328A9|nr:alpha/beta hydrolase [Bacillus sp. JCM 19034]